MAFLQQKYIELLDNISKICSDCGRDPHEITVLAATKYTSISSIIEALSFGVQVIGENRVQDALEKFPLIQQQCSKHFIGHLQTNKVTKAVQLFDVIESVDRIDLIEKLDLVSRKFQKKISVYIQVNIASDMAKFGCDIKMVPELCSRVANSQFLQLSGFMAIVPFFHNVQDSRKYFRSMKMLFDSYRSQYPSITALSMGMSNDYKIAIEEGATEIRIGSLLFD